MDFIETLLIALVAAIVVATIAFGVGYKIGRYDVVDAAWGWMFIVPAWVAAGVHGMEPYSLLLALVVTAWGMRLSYHIAGRIRATSHEDERYTEIRSKWPQQRMVLQVFVRIYLLQAVLATVVLVPVLGLIVSQSVDGALLAIGVAVALIGLAVETVADTQLRLFLNNPVNRGKLMTTGLWRYSRHPNYFGELLVWWGMGIAALGSILGPFGLVGPLVITGLLLFVSGVPLAERRAQSKPDWEQYKRKTPAVVPFISL